MSVPKPCRIAQAPPCMGKATAANPIHVCMSRHHDRLYKQAVCMHAMHHLRCSCSGQEWGVRVSCDSSHGSLGVCLHCLPHTDLPTAVHHAKVNELELSHGSACYQLIAETSWLKYHAQLQHKQTPMLPDTSRVASRRQCLLHLPLLQ